MKVQHTTQPQKMLQCKIVSFHLYPAHSYVIFCQKLTVLWYQPNCWEQMFPASVMRSSEIDDPCVTAAGKTYEGVATLNIFRDTKHSEGSYLLPPVYENRKNGQIKHYQSEGCCGGALESEKWRAL